MTTGGPGFLPGCVLGAQVVSDEFYLASLHVSDYI